MINNLDASGDDLGLLDIDTLDDSDWLLSVEKPDLSTCCSTEEWLQQDYDKPRLRSAKWSLIYALDIAKSRHTWSNHVTSPTRSPGTKPQHAPYVPGNSSSKDLTDIQILARMQEENLRESTLQRRRRTNSLMPQITTARNGDHFSNESRVPPSTLFHNGSHAQGHHLNGTIEINSHQNFGSSENGFTYSSDESPERFRGRNYSDQGTFRVKRRTPDKIRRPVIDSPNHSQLVLVYFALS